MILPTYVINLKTRVDRHVHIGKEFSNKPEFKVSIIEACEDKNGAVGLWNSIKNIISIAIKKNEDIILICEDDHEFTKDYNSKLLWQCIERAKSKNADILSGGVSWFKDSIEIGENIFWVKEFTGTQFVIVFKKLYQAILDANFHEQDTADRKFCDIFNNNMCTYPFVSIQKEFGYSDATKKNNVEGHVADLFTGAIDRFTSLKKVKAHYSNLSQSVNSVENISYDLLTIPTYIINLKSRKERLAHIKMQFENKFEFDIHIIEACEHKIGAVGLWQSIRKIIQLAKQNEDDVIIICEDDHEFTNNYSKEYLLKNIIEAHAQGVDYLSGGPSYVEHALAITDNRYWVASCLATQFIILYKNFFDKILNEPFDETVIADRQLSEMTSNKMVLFPSISRQKDFGYSDITSIHNKQKGLVDNMFKLCNERMNIIKEAMERNDIKPVC